MLLSKGAPLVRCVLLLIAISPASTAAQADLVGDHDWRFLTRATLSDDSHKSSPKGYEIHGGLTIEGALARDLNDVLAVELSLRAESREVDGPQSLPEPQLGSLDLIATALTVKWQPRDASGEVFQPYAGAGGTLTYVWEETGLLDSSDVPFSINPVVQIGSHLVLSPVLLLTLDVKWHPLELELERFTSPTPVVGIDPLVMGAGFGFAF